jgi:CO dehydrogenase/acetyl-CoA synthase epsilon subunit
MIVQHYDAIHVEESLLRKIKIKEHQLKIAQESNMPYVAEALQKQLLELRCQISQSQDREFQALMSLLDDEN